VFHSQLNRVFLSQNTKFLYSLSLFTYLGCSIFYQFSNAVESKLAKFLKLIGTIKRNIFRKVRTETILKIYNTLVLPTFYMGQKIGLQQPYKDEELKRQK